MGLDGISVNQLRITQENTSRENTLNSQMLAEIGSGSRSVNSLDKKGAIDTDDKENTSFFGGDSSTSEDEEDNKETQESVEYEKIDLSNKEMYEIKVDETTNSLTIYNKKENKTVQEITPYELSTLVDNLKNPGGILINKRI
ncbi:TPA: hypothetical protein IAA68_00380 [Candidatus Galligastranaerophilus faecipullorum]|nr:hypothetical protein [Candidatus Galligastranaerophilus faecipullorum]